ncbi:MAG: papain-like cysteine protease family protein [Candidatus Paceibacterota bacterium]
MKITGEAQNILVTKNDSTTVVVNDVVSVEYLEELATGEIVAYSQRDERWRSDIMVTSTIGGMGCAITACAMLGSQYNPGITPKSLNAYLKDNGGYTSDNRVYWAKVTGLVPELKFTNYYKWQDIKANLPLVLEELAKHPVILQVDFRPGGELDTHFVLALSSDGQDIEIIDPWDGAKTKLLQRYAKEGWNLERAVYAMVVYD